MKRGDPPIDLAQVAHDLDAALRDPRFADGRSQRRLKRAHRLVGEVTREDSGSGTNWKKVASYSLLVFGSMMFGHFVFSYWPPEELWMEARGLADGLDSAFWWTIAAGFLAQVVDSALGMGYGIISASFLLSMGINLPTISASIHTAEMFASGISGYSHYRFGNVDKQLFRKLVIPGVVGAVLGALALGYFGESYAHRIKPVLAAYIFFLGVKYILLSFRNAFLLKKVRHIGRLAGIGGFLDSFGGGGWGPLVTTTLLRTSDDPKRIIGSVSLTEFFVTLASAFTFFTLIGITHWQTIIALILGGAIAAPLGALLAGRLNKRSSFFLIGLLATAWSLRILWLALG